MRKAKKEEQEVTVVGEGVQEATEFVIPKDAVIDTAVTVVSLKGDPYHKDGDEFEIAKKTADMLVERGWVKIKE